MDDKIHVDQQDDLWPGLEQVLTVYPDGYFEHLEGPVVCSTLDGWTLWLIDRKKWLELRPKIDEALGFTH